MNLIPQPKEIKTLEGFHEGGVQGTVEVAGVLQIPAEGYRLCISKEEIRLEYRDSSGAFYGRQTLQQIVRLNSERLPCLEIKDFPSLKQRGYMLDISRCRVPKIDTLKRLIDLLALFKYNHLQLYTEHTFAYPNHQTVWSDASPYTAEDIQELDTYCAERLIELVPNQNSLGHFERWLKNPDYHKYAECPDGFVHPISGRQRPSGSTLAPGSESMDLVLDLYSQLLPNFRSKKFNIGCDEPWELGEGRSQKLYPGKSRGEIFCDWVGRLSEYLQETGYTPYIWADVALQYPEFLEQLPRRTHALLWGYESDHPFDEQCERLQKAGIEFLVCPGDSTWNSYCGRYNIAQDNILRAARAADVWGADGLLITHWGDNGHVQPWPTQFPGIVLGAECAWNGACANPELVGSGIDNFIAKSSASGLGDFLISIGEIDLHLDTVRFNRSLLYGLLRESPFEEDHMDALNSVNVRRLGEYIDALEETLQGVELNCDDRSLLHKECLFMLQALRACLEKAQTKEEGLARDTVSSMMAIWKKRFREGGLQESLRGWLD